MKEQTSKKEKVPRTTAIDMNNTNICSTTCKTLEIQQSKEPHKFDKEMLRFKIIYFLHNGGLAPALVFIPVYAKEELGFAAASLGAILTVQMFLFVFTKPLIGYIADYFNQLKVVICALSLLSLACLFSLLAIPKVEPCKIGNFSAFLSGQNLNSINLCNEYRNFLQCKQITNKASLTKSTNLAKTLFSNGTCMSCFIGNGNYLNNSDEIFITNCFEDSVFYLLGKIVDKEKQHLFCNQNYSFYSNFCSYHHNATQNYSDCEKLFCLRNHEVLEVNHLSKRNTFLKCSVVTEDSLKIFKSCLAQNLSTNNLIDTKNFEQETISDFRTYHFWIFAILFSISCICENANFTLVDTACCESIQKTNGDFGKLRLWGNIGWGLLAPIGGLLNDYTDGFISSWILMAIMLLLFLWNITQLDIEKPQFSKNILSDVGIIFRSKEFLSFELLNLLNGVGIGIIWFYLIWFLTTLGGTKFLGGLTIAVESFLGVIPCMFFSGCIIKKIGHYQILSAALLVYGVRFLFYGYLYNPWWVLPIEISHGLTYGLYYAVLASYGKLSSKPGTEATTQSILFTTHEGLGAGLGCVFAGLGFDHLGTHQTFIFISIYFGIDFIISLLLYFFIIRKQESHIKVNYQSDNSKLPLGSELLQQNL